MLISVNMLHVCTGGASVALKAGRNVVCVADGEELCTGVFTELAELNQD